MMIFFFFFFSLLARVLFFFFFTLLIQLYAIFPRSQGYTLALNVNINSGGYVYGIAAI